MRGTREEESGRGGGTQVCWLINRLLFVQRDTHTHTCTDTLSYILTENSAWVGSSWFFVPFLRLLSPSIPPPFPLSFLFSLLLLIKNRSYKWKNFVFLSWHTCVSMQWHTHTHTHTYTHAHTHTHTHPPLFFSQCQAAVGEMGGGGPGNHKFVCVCVYACTPVCVSVCVYVC